MPQWLTMKEAKAHTEKGAGIWEWASHRDSPDVVMACAGDTPTLEVLAAVSLLKKHVPDLKIREPFYKGRTRYFCLPWPPQGDS